MAAAEDTVVLDRGDGTTATIHLYGATLISWKVKGEEQIFVSSKSLFDNKKAIRGGIPLVFPCFGPWEHGPQHGFARINRWTVEKVPEKREPWWRRGSVPGDIFGADDNIAAIFSLVDNEETRAMWNHKFKLTYTVKLKATSIETSFDVANTGSDSFSFTCLLHTYFRVPDVTDVTVTGLSGLTYTDKVKGGEEAKEQRELVRVAESVDRVYAATPNEHVIRNVTGGKSIAIEKVNLPDTVVWNPWQEKAASMADFGDEDYPFMICVEAGRVASPQELTPGGAFHARQMVTLLNTN